MDLKDILMDEDSTIIQAMEVLDKAAKKALFIERDGVLAASLTDGDIRRWILAKGNLKAKVRDIANYNPKFVYEKDNARAKEYMKQYSIEALPILDENKKIVSVAFWDDRNIESKKEFNIPVVIMAGGLGTRLYPYTKILPKPLIPVGDLPIAEHIMNGFCSFGCKRFYIIVNHKKNMIKAYFNEIDKDYDITFIDEDKPLGTGGGISLLKGKIDTTFILSNCDIIVDENYEKMYRFHKEANNLITMICSLKIFTIPYGVVEIGEDGGIETMTEKPKMSFITNTGFYIVEPRVIEEMADDQSMSFPDIIEYYKQAGEKVGVYPISENAWMDMGQFDEMEKMRKRLSGDV